MLIVTVTTSEADSGKRLDAALTGLLASTPELKEHGVVASRSKVERWIESGAVKINGRKAARPSQPVSAGSQIEVAVPLDAPAHLAASSAVPFQILFEDADILVIDKPAGVVVHPGAGRPDDTLVNGLVHHLGDKLPLIGGALRPGIVHRLDKDTSGVMVVAKTELAYSSLVQQFKPPRTIKRSYLAVTARLPESAPGAEPGLIELPIGRHPTQRTKMAVRDSGKPARSHWRQVEELKYGRLLEVRIETGRTHQIRVHLAAVKAPIVGDPVYGPGLPNLPPQIRSAVRAFGRQALHARTLAFNHPGGGQVVEFSAHLPPDFELLLSAMRGIK